VEERTKCAVLYGVIILSLECINMKLYAIKNLRVNEITPPSPSAASSYRIPVTARSALRPEFLIPREIRRSAARLILRDIVFTSSPVNATR